VIVGCLIDTPIRSAVFAPNVVGFRNAIVLPFLAPTALAVGGAIIHTGRNVGCRNQQSVVTQLLATIGLPISSPIVLTICAAVVDQRTVVAAMPAMVVRR
jgi:hypothetical protein